MRRSRQANAMVAGGGGGGWKKTGERMAANRAKLQGLAIGTQGGVQEKIASGEIAGGMASEHTGTSIFDPVLTELAYRWFCPPTGKILDPFAGGSVRGIVASRLGYRYLGIDLRDDQIAANEVQAKRLCKKPKPEWVVGDSSNILATGKIKADVDFVFSCPPYADLEVYSDDPRDLSTMEYADFRAAYSKIVSLSCALLKPDRFACFVVGDARGPDGFYYGLPWHTIAAFEQAGLRLYNEAVLVTAVGSLPIRARKQFESTRKLGKTHQNVLVFCKGNPTKATSAIGKVEFSKFPDEGHPAAAFGEVL